MKSKKKLIKKEKGKSFEVEKKTMEVIKRAI